MLSVIAWYWEHQAQQYLIENQFSLSCRHELLMVDRSFVFIEQNCNHTPEKFHTTEKFYTSEKN